MDVLSSIVSLTLLIVSITVIIIFFRLPFLYQWIYACLSAFTLIAAVYESRFMNCNVYHCPPSTTQTPEQFVCQESTRINWRRAEILAFMILVVVNLVHPKQYSPNLLLFIVSWALIYFYLNFDQYHRATQVCRNITGLANDLP